MILPLLALLSCGTGPAVEPLEELAYAASPLRVAVPTFSPGAGTYSSTQSVTVRTASTGAAIYCTTDGSRPRRSASLRVSAPLSVSASQTVRCIAATLDGRDSSRIASAAYVINAESPPLAGWAAACAAEAEPTPNGNCPGAGCNIVYACDCQAGAQSGCQVATGPRDGSKANPWQTWGEVQAAFRALPAGGTVALCRGGRWDGNTGGGTQDWVNTRCSAAAPCVMRDYAAAWGGTAAPTIAQTVGGYAVVQLWGNATTTTGNVRFLNLRFLRPDAGGSIDARGTYALFGMDNVPNVEVCNCEINGFALGLRGSDTGTVCRTAGWKIRGNRFLNNCSFALYGQLKDTDIDGNYFDNNGHSLCGEYNISAGGATPHTLYLAGDSCPEENVRVINNEIHRSAAFQGDWTTVQTWVAGSGWVRSSGSWYSQPYPQGPVLQFKSGRNITFENNLIDLTPVHPAMGSVAITCGNDSAAYMPMEGIVIRRNRILAGRQRAIGLGSVVSATVEDNTIIVTEPDTRWDTDLLKVPNYDNYLSPSVVTVRNNTIYITKAAPANLSGIRVASAGAGAGNNVTGNSVTFAAGGGNACYQADTPSKVAFMDNNQCSGPPNYATNGTISYSLAGWRTLTGFDANSTTAAPLFKNAPIDFTPCLAGDAGCAGTSPLIGAASTATTCTVLGVANQSCTSGVAIDGPTWDPTATAKTRDGAPDIGAMER